MNSTQPYTAQSQTYWIKFLENEDLSTSDKSMYFDKESDTIKFSNTNRKIADYVKIIKGINKEFDDLPAKQKLSFDSLLVKNINLINSKIESHNKDVNSTKSYWGIFSKVIGLFFDMNLYKPLSVLDLFEYSPSHLEKIAKSGYELRDYSPHENTNDPLYKPFIEVNGTTYLIRFRYERESVCRTASHELHRRGFHEIAAKDTIVATVAETPFLVSSSAKIFPRPNDKFTYLNADKDFDNVVEMIDDYMVRHQLKDKTELVRFPEEFLESHEIFRLNLSKNQEI